MSIDASIPLRAGTAAQVNLADLFQQMDQRKAQQQEMDMRREQFDWQKQLHAEAMDKAKRDAIKAGLEDMASAVQWADTPDKWAQVQQHYGQYDPQLASVPFEQREAALVHLGQMGEYLKQTAPKIMAIEAGGSLAAVDPRTGKPNFTVLPNPGDAQPGAPAQAGGVREGATATNPQTGEKLIYRQGQWQPMGGGVGNGAGGF